jgi:hypothetical protein
MKKTKFKLVPKNVLIVIFSILMLGACRKSGNADERRASELVGDWKLSDLMLVNSGNNKPRKLEELPRLKDLRLIMTGDGQLLSGNNEKGTWSVIKDCVSLKFDGEEPLNLKISTLEPGFMALEYRFEADNGSDAGTIYYAFAR